MAHRFRQNMFHFFSGASQWAGYAAVNHMGRLPKHSIGCATITRWQYRAHSTGEAKATSDPAKQKRQLLCEFRRMPLTNDLQGPTHA